MTSHSVVLITNWRYLHGGFLSFFCQFLRSLPHLPALTPGHSRSLLLTPAHSRSLPLSPALYRSLPLTPALYRSLPLTPAHSRSLQLTPARADARISTGEWQKPQEVISNYQNSFVTYEMHERHKKGKTQACTSVGMIPGVIKGWNRKKYIRKSLLVSQSHLSMIKENDNSLLATELLKQ